ncbi:MAG: hypothetical protein H6581_16170 [Bacteroidia bacterium]|nr:hypothetical protein [Bacteroidia bacterium]
MDGKNRKHIIQRQVFEIETNSRAKAEQINRDLGEIYRNRILPVIEKLFDEFSVPGYVMRIERLDLDLGDIDANDFEYLLEKRIRFQLQNQLIEARAKAEKKAISNEAKAELIPIGPARLESLMFFLVHGYLAPGADNQEDTFDEILAEMIRTRPGQLVTQLTNTSRNNPQVVSRLVRQFSAQNLTALLRLLAGSREPMLSQFLRKMEGEHKQFASLPKREYLALIQESIFRYVLERKGTSFRNDAFLEQVKLTLSDKTGSPVDISINMSEVDKQEKALSKEGEIKVIESLLRAFSRKQKVLGKYDPVEVLDWVIRKFPADLVQKLRNATSASLRNILQGIAENVPSDLLLSLINLISPGRRYWIIKLLQQLEKSLGELQARMPELNREQIRNKTYALLLEGLLEQSGTVIDEVKLKEKIAKDLPSSPTPAITQKVLPLLDQVFGQTGTPETGEEEAAPMDRETWFRAMEARERQQGMPVQARLDTIAHFFFFGEMPWWAPNWKTPDLERELDFFLEREANSLKETFETLFASIQQGGRFREFALRLVRLLSREKLEKWIHMLLPELSGFVVTITLALEKVFEEYSEVRSASRANSAKVFAWIPILWVFYEYKQKGVDPPQVNDWVNIVMRLAAEFSSISEKEMIKFTKAVSKTSAEAGETRFNPLVAMLDMAGFSMPSPETKEISPLPPDPFGADDLPETKAENLAEAQSEAGEDQNFELSQDELSPTENLGTDNGPEKDVKAEESAELQNPQDQDLTREKDADELEGKVGETSKSTEDQSGNLENIAKPDSVGKEELAQDSIEKNEPEDLSQTGELREQKENEMKSEPEQEKDSIEDKKSLSVENESSSNEEIEALEMAQQEGGQEKSQEGSQENSEEADKAEEQIGSPEAALENLPMPAWRVIDWYLNNGSLPIQVAFLSEKQVFRLFEIALAKEPDQMEKILRKAMAQTNIRTRMVKNLPEALLWKVLELVRPAYVPELKQYLAGLRPLFVAPGSPAPPEILLEHALFFAIDNRQEQFATFTYVKNLARYLVRRVGDDLLRVLTWMEEGSGKVAPQIREGFFRSAEVLRKEAEKSPSAGEKLNIKLPQTQVPTGPKEGEPIFVKNAGIVILWPFYVHLFKYLDLLTPGKNFKDEKAAHKAVHVMQYCATEQENSPEYLLPLNKLLCNLPLDMPIEAGVKITDDEKELCDKLVMSACRQWEPMKNTSPRAFRGAFCVRDGKLVYKNEKWTLTVEQGPWDMLMDKMSWGVSMVKLPWMPKMLHVNWR